MNASMKGPVRDDDSEQNALLHVGRALVRIRSLSQKAQREPESVDEILRGIETLADAAHNIPQLLATMGQNDWASQETLANEVTMCEAALLAR